MPTVSIPANHCPHCGCVLQPPSPHAPTDLPNTFNLAAPDAAIPKIANASRTDEDTLNLAAAPRPPAESAPTEFDSGSSTPGAEAAKGSRTDGDTVYLPADAPPRQGTESALTEYDSGSSTPAPKAAKGSGTDGDTVHLAADAPPRQAAESAPTEYDSGSSASGATLQWKVGAEVNRVANTVAFQPGSPGATGSPPHGATLPVSFNALGSTPGASPASLPSPPRPAAGTLSEGPVVSPFATLTGTGEPRAPRQAPLAVKVPGYIILQELGRGGMGVVYKARQTSLNRLVALKMILIAGHAPAADLVRFRTEAEAMARLQHPNIVQIYEIGEHEGLPFFSLEFCPGGSLDQQLDSTPQPPLLAAQMVQTLARAMQVAHQANVIHRDLKPANILLLADGTPKITDFGLAKKLDEQSGATRSGAVMGTPSYMAPEQAEGKKGVGPAADVYALGALLYEMLTGRAPFKGATPLDTIMQVITHEPVPPTQFQVATPKDLETICLKCLNKDAAKRYASALELAEDLRRWQEGKPIVARRLGTGERLVKWTRRNPAVAGLAAVSVLALLSLAGTGVVAALYQSHKAETLRQQMALSKKMRGDVDANLQNSRQFEDKERWGEAQTELANARRTLFDHPELQTDALGEEIESRLAHVEKQLARQEQQQQAHKLLKEFQAAYRDALFHETMFSGLGVADSQARTRAAAEQALKLYGFVERTKTPGGAPALLAQAKQGLSEQEYARLAADCYELFLVWAEAVAQDGGQAEHGLRALGLLDQAAGLGAANGLHSRSIHVRRARYQAQAGVPVVPAPPGKEETALDWFLTGLAEYKAGNTGKAAQACSQVLARQPEHFWASYVLGLCQLRNGQWAESKTTLTQCLNLNPDFVWPRLLRGFAASERGFAASKLALQLRKLPGLQGQRAEEEFARSEEEFTSARADFDQALTQDKSSLAQYVGLNNRGVMFIRQKRWKEALTDLEKAVDVKKEAIPAYINLAKACEGAQRFEQGVKVLGEAVELASREERAVLYGNRAQMYQNHGDGKAAREDLERAIECEEKGGKTQQLVEHHVLLGHLLINEKQYEDALKHLDAALKIQPKNESAHRPQAECLLALKRLPEAAAALDHHMALVTLPTPDICTARGLIHVQGQEYRQAVDMYTLALRQNPSDARTYTLRGWAYLLMEAAHPALEDFEQALRLDDKNADALAGRGNARIRLRQRETAVSDAEQALEVGPATDRLLFNVACIYSLVLAQTRLEVSAGRDRQAPRMVLLYEDRALNCLERTLAVRPPEGRAAFWREVIEKDPALDAVRRSPKYPKLAQKYGGNRF
jgi:eukaryotic-like serine/threonine-protein kinase